MSSVVQDIMFLLDESGSMESMGKEPVQAVNKFIQDQQKTMGDDGATFSLWKFNSTVVKLIDDVPLQQVKEFTDFRPDQMTALYDAIGQAIKNKSLKEKHDDVICVILTDGLDNQSKEFSASSICSLIKTETPLGGFELTIERKTINTVRSSVGNKGNVKMKLLKLTKI